MSNPAEMDQTRPFWRRPIVLAAAAAALLVLLWAVAGRRYKPRAEDAAQPDRAAPQTWNEELLDIAMQNLVRMEEFEGPEMLYQSIDQLDQWIQGQRPLEGWQPDPMLATLPEHLAALPPLKDLAKLSFSRPDGLAFQEAILMRDISNRARGEQADPLQQAKRLFDWTVRNIQLGAWLIPTGGDPPYEPGLQLPFETLLSGQGMPNDRVWVFMLLARQQGLDAVLLALYDPNDPTKRQIHGWLAGVLIGGELYLFDPTLGLPIPAPGEIRRAASGELDIQPATLAQVAADDSLLRRLDADEANPYPIKAALLKQVVALVEASPPYLSQRMRMVESRLAGAERLVLATSPSEVAGRLKQCEHVAEARLWLVPYQLLYQRARYAPHVAKWHAQATRPFAVGQGAPLEKGRMLHLKGKSSGERSAADWYQLARPSDRTLDAATLDPDARANYRLAKAHASYWLGLLAAEQGNYRAAEDFFVKRTLEADPDGPWTHGARYNLGRIYEAQGQTDKAIEQYEGDLRSPSYHGNLLRARWLGSKTGRLPAEVPPLEKPAAPFP